MAIVSADLKKIKESLQRIGKKRNIIKYILNYSYLFSQTMHIHSSKQLKNHIHTII